MVGQRLSAYEHMDSVTFKLTNYMFDSLPDEQFYADSFMQTVLCRQSMERLEVTQLTHTNV